MNDQERRARAAWSRLAEPGDRRAVALVSRLGHAGALDAVRSGSSPEAEHFAPRLAASDLERDLEVADRCGLRLVVPGDDAWPAGLDDLEHPPHCLWVRGPVPDLRRSVAVVGARACTDYGTYHARDIAFGLAERGWVVVSGAAFGIDAAAHEGALAAGGTTLAVLACGAERAYPAAHRDLIGAIAASGGIVSEVPPGSAPTRYRFLQRNRLIATMTAGTVVVEAALRSGALNTARTAAVAGRPVAALPGPVDAMSSAGCHEAIRLGVASLVTDAADVVDLVGALGEDSPERAAPDAPRDALGPDEQRVLGAFPAYRARSTEELAAAAGTGLQEALGALVGLELSGWVVRDERGWRRVLPSKRPRAADGQG